MKKICCLLLMILLLAFCSCGNDDIADNTDIFVTTKETSKNEVSSNTSELSETNSLDFSNTDYTFDNETKTLYFKSEKVAPPSYKDKNYDYWVKLAENTEKVVLKDGVKEIAEDTFRDFGKLKYIEVSATVATEEDFIGNNQTLESVSVDSANRNLSSENGVLFNKDKTKLIKYPAKQSSTSYIIPESVTAISNYAFWHAHNLEQVTLPAKLETSSDPSIWFMACDSLGKISVSSENDNFASDNQGVLYNKNMTEIILIPAKVSEIVIPDTVTGLSCYALAHKCEIKTITLGENFLFEEWFLIYEFNAETINVSENSKHYFSEDGVIYSKEKTELLWYPYNKTDKIFTVPDTVVTVKHINNPNIEELIFSDSVRRVNRTSLSSCTSLKKVHFGKNMEEIIYDGEFDVENQNPFWNCKKLETITVSPGNKHFKSDKQGALYLYDMSSIITVPANGNIREFTVPDSVTIIMDCFKNCSRIKKIHFGKNTEKICVGVSDTESIVGFSGCTSLESISVSKDNKYFTNIDGILFSKDMKILYLYPANKTGERYIVPENVELVHDYAFLDSQNIKMIYLFKNTKASLSSFPKDDEWNLTADIYCEGSQDQINSREDPRYHFNVTEIPE